MLKFKISIAICIICMVFSCQNRQISKKIDKGSNNTDKIYEFPQDWLGYWEGEIKIYNHSGFRQKTNMAYDIQKTEEINRWIWAIIYGEDKEAGRRSYFLEAIDIDKGHYQVDEDNGILLDSYLIGNRLISTFEVMGTILTSIQTMEGDRMIFEIIAGPYQSIATTGDTIMNGDTIPAVQSFQTRVYQKAILHRKKR